MPGPPLPPGPLLLRRRRPWDLTSSPVGGLPLPVLEVPYEWLLAPLTRRPTTPINAASISQAGGATVYSTNTASVSTYGVSSATATLTTACDADPGNLATHLTTYYATPRPRQPVMVFNLVQRTDAEAQLLLGVGLLRRVRIIHIPTGWPPGAANFTVEGIHHSVTVEQRLLQWSTAAVVGTTTTDPGPWFRWDSSSWDGPDLRPF